MQQTRFELSSEQTLHLAELRDILAQTLPTDIATTVEFTVGEYGCSGRCSPNCGTGCAFVCTGTCKGTCLNYVANGCGSGCQYISG